MKYTHKIDFFSNLLKVRIEDDVVVAVESGDFASCCPECMEDIEGYWLLKKNPETGSLEAMCPSAKCSSWPVTEIVKKVSK